MAFYNEREKIDGQVAALTAGTGVSLSYDGSVGTLTINGQVGDITGVARKWTIRWWNIWCIDIGVV